MGLLSHQEEEQRVHWQNYCMAAICDANDFEMSMMHSAAPSHEKLARIWWSGVVVFLFTIDCWLFRGSLLDLIYGITMSILRRAFSIFHVTFILEIYYSCQSTISNKENRWSNGSHWRSMRKHLQKVTGDMSVEGDKIWWQPRNCHFKIMMSNQCIAL